MNSDLIWAAREMLPDPEASVTAIDKSLRVTLAPGANTFPTLREPGAAGRARAALSAGTNP